MGAKSKVRFQVTFKCEKSPIALTYSRIVEGVTVVICTGVSDLEKKRAYNSEVRIFWPLDTVTDGRISHQLAQTKQKVCHCPGCARNMKPRVPPKKCGEWGPVHRYKKGHAAINGDQMPRHRNENYSQKTISIKREPTFAKVKYMLL